MLQNIHRCVIEAKRNANSLITKRFTDKGADGVNIPIYYLYRIYK